MTRVRNPCLPKPRYCRAQGNATHGGDAPRKVMKRCRCLEHAGMRIGVPWSPARGRPQQDGNQQAVSMTVNSQFGSNSQFGPSANSYFPSNSHARTSDLPRTRPPSQPRCPTNRSSANSYCELHFRPTRTWGLQRTRPPKHPRTRSSSNSIFIELDLHRTRSSQNLIFIEFDLIGLDLHRTRSSSCAALAPDVEIQRCRRCHATADESLPAGAPWPRISSLQCLQAALAEGEHLEFGQAIIIRGLCHDAPGPSTKTLVQHTAPR